MVVVQNPTQTNPKDDVVDALLEDLLFFEEEIQIAKTEIKKIQDQLNIPNLSAETFNVLHTKLREVYQRFLAANAVVQNNAKQLEESLGTAKNSTTI